MASTFNTRGIVINRFAHREYDSRVTVYTLDFGKIDLLARGAQRSGSKLAAHIEPLSLVDLMIIKGKRTDYIGSAIVNDSYAAIKADLEKLQAAGKAINVFNRLVRHDEKDETLFALLAEFLDIISRSDQKATRLLSLWSLKFLAALGYKPELYNCLGCSKRLEPTENYFSASRGGVFCPACSKNEHQSEKLDETSVKIMRLALYHTLNDLVNLRAEEKDWQRVGGAINNLLNFNIHN